MVATRSKHRDDGAISTRLNEMFMGQINLMLIGQHYLNEGGSITLTRGRTSHEPYDGGSSCAGRRWHYLTARLWNGSRRGRVIGFSLIELKEHTLS